MTSRPHSETVTFVILLRGVMPSGKNRVPMEALRVALTHAGLVDVRTYIQSGNVIADSRMVQADVEELVHGVILENFGGDLTVVARTAVQFRRILDRNPFPVSDAPRLYFTVLVSKPSPKSLTTFRTADWEPDDVRLIDDVVYTRYATKHSDSKFNNNFFERRLNVAATTRNFNTMTKLAELSSRSSVEA